MDLMSTLHDWLHKIKIEAEKDNPQLSENLGRLIAPGFTPLDHEGFIRMKAEGAVDGVGSAPEAISVAQWLDTANDTLNDLPTSLSASLTFLADRRIEILNEAPTRVEGTNRVLFFPYSTVVDKRLISPPQSGLDDKSIRKLFIKIASLKPEDDKVIVQALNLHYASVLLYDKDLPAAYALLVAGLEALSGSYGDVKTDWNDWDMAVTWDKFIANQKLSDTQADALRKKLIKDKKMRLGDTFARYVSGALPQTFWTNANAIYTYTIDSTTGRWVSGNWDDAKPFSNLVPTDREVVYSALKHTYNARSKYVHEGLRMITPLSEITGLSNIMDGTKPVPFALLRTMLTSLIKIELDDRSNMDFELPNILMTHGDEMSATRKV